SSSSSTSCFGARRRHDDARGTLDSYAAVRSLWRSATMRAVVLLSGGLDSATTLAIARSAGYECHAVTFDYGQRHRAERAAATRIAVARAAASFRALALPSGSFGGSALTATSLDVPGHGGDGIPGTYVPARNTIWLAMALGLAEVLDAPA